MKFETILTFSVFSEKNHWKNYNQSIGSLGFEIVDQGEYKIEQKQENWLTVSSL